MPFVSLSKISGQYVKQITRMPSVPLLMTPIRKNKKGLYRLTIRLTLELLRQVRWQPGDRVDVQVDPKLGLGLIKRVQSPDGFVLSFKKRKGVPDSETDPAKKYETGTAKLTLVYREAFGFPMPKEATPINHCVTEDGYVLFDLPGVKAADGTPPPPEPPRAPPPVPAKPPVPPLKGTGASIEDGQPIPEALRRQLKEGQVPLSVLNLQDFKLAK